MFGHDVHRLAIRASGATLLLASVTLASLGFAQLAAAATPTIEQFQHPASFVVADCGSFQIVGSWIFDVRIATYFDETGTAVRQELNIRRQGTIMNSVTGKSLDDSGAFSFIVDLATGTSVSPGVGSHDTAPGVGILWLGAGLIRVDAAGNVTWATPHADMSQAAACTYFAS